MTELSGVELFRQMILAAELRMRLDRGASFATLSAEYYLSEQEVRDLVAWAPEPNTCIPLTGPKEHAAESTGALPVPVYHPVVNGYKSEWVQEGGLDELV